MGQAPSQPEGGCPLRSNSQLPCQRPDYENTDLNKYNMMEKANQNPSPGQPFSLAKERTVSSIPKVTEDGKEDKWVYPSEQMFWNAMIRKGWRWRDEEIKKEDMTAIIHIHNKNNEAAWKEILEWERFAGYNPDGVKLLKFSGDAKKFTPKARLRRLLGYEYPFDRHDWVIDRYGKEVRYVLDYYDVGSENGHKSGDFIHIDIRPCLDSFEAFRTRARAFFLRNMRRLLKVEEPKVEENV